MKDNLYWEWVDSNTRTKRARVPGGWLVRAEAFYSTKTIALAICFYPDPNSEWIIDQEVI